MRSVRSQCDADSHIFLGPLGALVESEGLSVDGGLANPDGDRNLLVGKFSPPP
jgi:hypothetical protein